MNFVKFAALALVLAAGVAPVMAADEAKVESDESVVLADAEKTAADQGKLDADINATPAK